MPLPTEELRRRADAYREHGTLKKAAAALGIKKSALSESHLAISTECSATL